jgi:hypothetical protein
MCPVPRGGNAAAWAILSLALLVPTARAQAPQPEVRLAAVLIDAFPEVTLFASASDAQDQRLAGLPREAFQILEDDTEVALGALREEEVGARLVFVLHTARGLTLRDSLGRRRYDFVRQALQDWWRMPEAARIGRDDLTLWTDGGPVVSHSDSAAELASALGALEPTFTRSQNGLEVLQAALATTAGPPPRPGMVNQIVFITPYEAGFSPTSLTSILEQARTSRTSIYPIHIAPADAAELPQTLALQQLAVATGGEYLRFEPGVSLEELAARLLDQRVQYRLTYQSPVNVPGTHKVQVRLVHEGLDITSDLSEYNVDVRSPEVTFVNPPLLITRTSNDSGQTYDTLPPTHQYLRLLVEFPDGHPRNLIESQLLVDGAVFARKTSPPWEEMIWDLRGFQQDGEHRLQAVVIDRLGLQGTTEPVTIEVRVDAPPGNFALLRPGLPYLAAATAVLLAGAVVVAFLSARPKSELAVLSSGAGRRKAVLRRAGMARPGTAPPAEAYLVPEMEGEERIPLVGSDVVLGRDPSLAAVRLEDASVSPIHARLIRQADGGYILRDQGSIAGTWLNAEQVPAEGRRLRHGDFIHLGRVAFRFRLAAEPPPLEVRLTASASPNASPEPTERPT